MPGISVVIITYNESSNIERCIASANAIADEVIVLDSYSTDDTVAKSKALGAKVYEYKFENHIQQKNKAITYATHDYILSLDADEALDENLLRAITKIKNEKFIGDAYTMNRLANYCNAWITTCGWYPDTKLRLFNKHKGAWGGINPHDKWLPHSDASLVKHLEGNILHYTFQSYAEHLAQAHRYSTIGAQADYASGKRSNYLKVIMAPLLRFVRDYIFNRGFTSGVRGYNICKISAYTTYLKYKKILHMQQSNNNNNHIR